MNVTRLITAGLLGAITTAVLIVVMFKLVDREWDAPDETERRKLADFNMPQRDIETQYDQEKPEKPEKPEPEPDMPEPDFDTPDVAQESVSVATPTVDSAVGEINVTSFDDGEYLPIVRVEPIYPTRAASRGIEGYVIVEFTVTTNGSVRDPMVVESEPSSIFNRAAERAVMKWKFKPRVVDGTPVEVPGVQTQLTFKLDN
ncbi:energy transducer TonB [Gilvimarinus sp. F26214L]|uniref:energy transducer TonB n=1 Tax=Gilvimarinus sp. DZF01 TaxID=3461371 RepID=UPI0040467040